MLNLTSSFYVNVDFKNQETGIHALYNRFFCRQSLVKTSLEVQSFVQYYITCIEDEVERSQVLKVVGDS